MFDQLLRQPHRRSVGKTREHHFRNLFRLLPDRVHDFGLAVTVAGTPPGRDAVQQFLSRGQLNFRTPAGNREIHRRRIQHRGVRMPQVFTVEIQKFVE